MGVPRNKIEWFPKIDQTKCDLCGTEPQCLRFCPHNVFNFEKDTSTLSVINPTNCVVFCRACNKVCHAEALHFPEKKDVLNEIRKLRSF